MRLVFIGASGFGLKCLGSFRNMDAFDVVGVVSAPQKFSISYNPQGVVNVLHADFHDYCKRNDYPLLIVEKDMKDDFLLQQVCIWRPQIFIVVGWYHMIPKRWRQVAPAYGLHASILPDYSGGAPLVWAMINGENKTGITLFQLSDGVDNGPVVAQSETEINESDTIATLYTRIEDLGIDLIRTYMPRLANGTASLIEQDESKRRVYAQRTPDDGLINWDQSANDLYNFVRAQTKPYPGAYTIWQGKQLKIWKARPSSFHELSEFRNGEVLPKKDAALVKTGEGVLELEEVAFEEKSCTGKEFRGLIGSGVILGK